MPTSSPERHPRRIIVAIGGNAITQDGGDHSVAQDYANLRRSLDAVVTLVERGYEVILTHGNGPQVGNQMTRVELALGEAPDLPLDVMVADLQGGLGYMIERVLRNKLLDRGRPQSVCVMLTLVEVDPDDPAFQDPTKFVGPVFPAEEVDELRDQRGWVMKEDRGRGWRRVVASPEPISVVERRLICTLIEADALVIVTGGGGIPVASDETGRLRGIEGVIDKDLTAAVLGREIGAQELFILTGVPRVALHFGTPQQSEVASMTVAEARDYLAAGHFPPGSMGPKVRAACRFVEEGGQRALITDVFTLLDALDGKTGTWVTA
jgi:carbamate kinase